MNKSNIISVTPDNVAETGIYCIKNKNAPGYQAKVEWFKNKCNEGLQIKIASDSNNKQLGFIEYIPSEFAWRPVHAENYLFIHCIVLFVMEARNSSIGSSLLVVCEQDAKKDKKYGVCVITSKGPWIADKTLFEKNGYFKVDELDRFELMVKKFDYNNPTPKLIDWKKQQIKYKGWNLVYADQCPWHEKSVNDLKKAAKECGINLKVKKLNNPDEAKKAPSGFGVYSLIRDGRLIEDHYLSKTRFENILKKELKT